LVVLSVLDKTPSQPSRRDPSRWGYFLFLLFELSISYQGFHPRRAPHAGSELEAFGSFFFFSLFMSSDLEGSPSFPPSSEASSGYVFPVFVPLLVPRFDSSPSEVCVASQSAGGGTGPFLVGGCPPMLRNGLFPLVFLCERCLFFVPGLRNGWQNIVSSFSSDCPSGTFMLEAEGFFQTFSRFLGLNLL